MNSEDTIDIQPHDPVVYVLGGPNGAGKSTIANLVIPSTMPFLNADLIAAELRAGGRENPDIEAGRILLGRMDEMAGRRISFAVETNLAGRTLAVRLARMRTLGYYVRVVFVWLNSPMLAVRRVGDRVNRGGHDIPVATIIRRYDTGIRNFLSVYMPLSDDWRLYDNSRRNKPRLVAVGTTDRNMTVYEPTTWRRIFKEWGDEQISDSS